ncbi:hypothetical protein [Lacticaseibacillus paracasei]|uniref:hypothetical protein n=1 Tax=Lacticaseibacillus paracasei TaxID=1597 RepID=UPI000BC3527A|nr:hypothetical protein [Lacticaseibacillus paracasei]ATG98908.1 hypothetical protein FAM18149p_05755 [Lacticaseibacillus paracasei]RND78247.1 hypothetical protein FAM18149_01105 [Lacticaseibacillus paracasei]RND85057.1 hypothetical protein FAM18168_01022 [Lacticaseibacillus paracasei]
MLNEKTIKELISLPCFLANASKLAYQLGMSRQDASQELLLELLDHRLRKWTNKDVTMAIAKDLPSLKWRIKYARKDLVRQSHKDATRELDKVQMLAGMEPQASNQAETLEALSLIPNLFKNANTRDWVASVLRVGQKETMLRFNDQTSRQFNCKLNKVCRYARKWQPKQPNSHAKELKLLKEWDDLMADPETSDDDVQTFIGQHEEYINEVINSPLIKYQATLVKDFAQASNKDKYILVNLMAKREQELDRRTNHE